MLHRLIRPGAMPAPTAFDSMSRDEARSWMQTLGLPRVAGGEETPEEKAAREKTEADKAEVARLKAEDDERKALGEPGKRALDAEREAKEKIALRAKAEKERADAAETARKVAQDELDKIKADQSAAETERLKKAGEFEKVATDAQAERDALKKQLDDVTAERDALKADADKIVEANEKRWTDGVKALPEAVRKVYVPKDTMPLADRLEWLDAIQKANGSDGNNNNRRNGNGRNPREQLSETEAQDRIARNAATNYSG